DVTRHLAAILSIERLFTCLHYLLNASGGRDEFVRQLLLFHVVDMLEGLRRGSFDQLVTASRVEQQLARLKTQLPPDVAIVVLWKGERALEALKAAAVEFYLHERIRDGRVQVMGDNGQPQWLAIDKALAQYLQL